MTSRSLKYEHFHENALIAESDRPFAEKKSTGAKVSTFSNLLLLIPRPLMGQGLL
jgi:hypothetical protein